MNFSEWYKSTYGNSLDQDFAQIGSFMDIVKTEYRDYCKKNKIKPNFKK